MYRNAIAVDTRARISAPIPNAAVPPSVRHACLRLTKNPQRKSAVVNSNESVALQMLCTADAILCILAFLLMRSNCITADKMASGPRRLKMSRRSSFDG